MIESDSSEHRGDFQRMTDATRSGGHGNALQIERQRQAFAFDEFDADVQVRADAARAGRGTVESDVFDVAFQSVPKRLLKSGGVRGPFRQFAGRHFRGHARADDGRDIFRTSAQPAFLHPAMKKARQARAPVPIEHADSFRSVKPVRRERERSVTL